MGMPQPQARFDAAAYLAWEAVQAERHEYVGGEVYAMTGARDAHNRVAGNIYVALRGALQGTPCRTYMSDMKLHVAAADAYFYPDVFVTCDERDRSDEADLAKRHPTLLVEVLSDSTGAYDRGRKFEFYRSVASLVEVAFVDPDRRQVDLFRRNTADGLWVLHPAGGNEALNLASLDIQIPLDVIYADVVPLSPPPLAATTATDPPADR